MHKLVGPGEFYPCSDFDTLSQVTLTADRSDALSVAPLNAKGPQANVLALAEGTTRLTVTAVSQSGEALTQTAVVETRQPAHHELHALEGPRGTPPLPLLPGRHENFGASTITDRDGTALEGDVDYRVTGPTDFDGGEIDFIASAGGVFGGELGFEALAPGEVRIEPVPEALRQVTSPLVFEVAAPDDVAALRFATALYSDAGLILPPPLLTQVTSAHRDGGFGPGQWFGRPYPLLELKDGGWARADLSTLRAVRAGQDAGTLTCTNETCYVELRDLGENTFALDVPPLTFTTVITVVAAP